MPNPKAHADGKTSANNGWRRVTFGEMAEIIGDRVDNPSEAGVERYVGLEHLDPESLRIRRWGTPDQVEATKLRFKPGDIIFGKRRAYQRKLAVADFEGICSAHAMVLRAREETVVKDFLPVFMQSEVFFERALAVSVGSLSPTINWKTLAIQEFSIPPKDEQRRIAEILWGADTSVSTFEEVRERGGRLRKQLLFNIFQDARLNNVALRFKERKVAECGRVRLGRQRAPKYQSGNHKRPYLRVANVFDGFLDLSDVLSMDFDERDSATYRLEPGDILLNEGQSRELVGRSCIYRGEIEDCCFQNTLIRFRASPGTLPEYAQAQFQFSLYSGRFAEIASQTTSIAHLGADRFSEMPFAYLGLKDQERVLSVIREVENGLRQALAHLRQTKALKSSLASQLLGPSNV
jgi:restriction endonuclease S subunit